MKSLGGIAPLPCGSRAPETDTLFTSDNLYKDAVIMYMETEVLLSVEPRILFSRAMIDYSPEKHLLYIFLQESFRNFIDGQKSFFHTCINLQSICTMNITGTQN